MSSGQAIVIDNGSSTCKAGFVDDDVPQVILPTIIGQSKDQNNGTGDFIGNQVNNKRELLNLTYPIENGIITNFDEMEKVWHHIFYNQLKVNPEDHPFLLSEIPFNPKPIREKIIETMFETFNTPAGFLAMQPVLSLYANGRTTGIVLNSGGGLTNTVPIYDGFAITDSILQYKVAGEELTNYFMNSLNESRRYSFSTADEREIVQDMKEKLCYVSANFEEELKSFTETNFELPDGQVITVGTERIRCPEALFQPSFQNTESPSVHKSIFDSISKCDIDIRKDMYANIILSGGNTLFSGFSDRLEKEIKQLAPKSVKVKIIHPPDRKYSVWIGGSVMGNMSVFKDFCITRNEYNEAGPHIVHTKC